MNSNGNHDLGKCIKPKTDKEWNQTETKNGERYQIENRKKWNQTETKIWGKVSNQKP
jgi:hypothetical protein